ncbi:MAG: PmoA family protein [Isosphaeraceae bacterium]|nr:PmoA family protein [Isosphaeraceae bacterium]
MKAARNSRTWIYAAAMSLLASTASPAADRLRILGNGTELGETPIVASIPAKLAPGVYRLSVEGRQPIRASVFREGDENRIALVLPGLGAREAIDFAIEPAPGSAEPVGIRLTETTDAVHVALDGKAFTRHLSAAAPKPFLHPLIGPTGEPFTRAFPMLDIPGEKRDHPHQRSFWFTHGKVNGIDFWSEMKGHGSIKETSRKIMSAGPVMAELRTTDDWLGPDGKKILDDERTIRFYATTTARIVDFSIVLRAGKDPVVFGDTKEGMFGVRVATSMDVTSKQGGKITNAEGLTDDKAWGKASPWVDYTGPVAGKTVGIAILDHPSSFRHPTTWHVRTYGLFAANPFGWKDFGRPDKGDHTIAPGESIRFAYRVVLHTGDTESARPAAAFAGFAVPPKVDLVSGE